MRRANGRPDYMVNFSPVSLALLQCKYMKKVSTQDETHWSARPNKLKKSHANVVKFQPGLKNELIHAKSLELKQSTLIQLFSSIPALLQCKYMKKVSTQDETHWSARPNKLKKSHANVVKFQPGLKNELIHAKSLELKQSTLIQLFSSK